MTTTLLRRNFAVVLLLIVATPGVLGDAWPMKHRDMRHTGRSDYVVPAVRMNDSFFDVKLWQKPSPNSPDEGNFDSGSLVFCDGVGPGGVDLIVGGYHWPKGVQGMNRHTGQTYWFGLPSGGESIGTITPAFSLDGSVVYVMNDATESGEWPQGHPLMAFQSTVGPSTYWHNGADPEPWNLGMGNPTIAPDGRIFVHSWVDRPYAATDSGSSLSRTWAAATGTDSGLSDPTLHAGGGALLVVSGSRSAGVIAHDGATGAELWSTPTPTIDATGTIDPANGNVYFPAGTDSVWVIGLTSAGQPLWPPDAAHLVFEWVPDVNGPQRAQAAGALAHDGATYYFQTNNPDGEGRLYAVNTADGSLKWTYPTGSRGWEMYSSSPTVTPNGVIVIGNNEGGTYYALRDAGTSAELLDTLEVAAPGRAQATAAIAADGTLYLPVRMAWTVGNGDGETPTFSVQNVYAAFDLLDHTPPPPPAPDALTEMSAAQWAASADEGSASVYDDVSRFVAGGASIRYETDGCFDTRLWSPPDRDASWNLIAAGSGGVGFFVYAENDDGFQNYSPTVRLGTTEADYYAFVPNYDVLNDAMNQWVFMRIPLNGDALWTRSVVGSPSLADIRYVEIHADTWGCSFTLWFDGLTFNLPFAPPQGLVAIAGDVQVNLKWQAFEDPLGTFDHYAIYRDVEPFDTTVGKTPLATLSGIDALSYVDTDVVNGVGYHYAVTAVFANGDETSLVTSVGPRVPRHELDVQVTHISRAPRYPRYCPEYAWYELTEPGGFGPYGFSAATGLGCGQDENTQRWPNIGDLVTYTAYVRNRGTAPADEAAQAEWRVDGAVVSSESLALALAPDEEESFAYQRVWDGEQHEVRFELIAADDRPLNNARTIWTKSAPFLTYVDRSAIEDFRDRTTPLWPGAVTDDLIDWLQRHMDEMNAMFAAAGSTKRVHYDHLEVLGDDAADPTIPETIDFGIFPFRYTYANIGDPRSPGYYHSDVDIDYGLCHELSHQLGLIDLYQLDLPGEWNQVSGLPYSTIPGLMHGVSPLYSEHSARAMTHWNDVVHGYYGQYLYQIPEHLRLRVLGANGQPLVGAHIRMYQMCERPGIGKVITDQVKAEGVTDAGGYWVLPNVPISQTGVAPTSLIGDTLPDNPFGWIAVVGTNGVLHFKVEYADLVDYCWLDIAEVNVAYWRGATQLATFERPLNLGDPQQLYPPGDLTEMNAGDWSAWVDGGSGALTDDAVRKVVGQASVKFVTDGGFDNRLTYPSGFLARWNLAAADALRFWAYAENPNLGFQGGSPWIILHGLGGSYIEYHPTGEVLNDAIGQWHFFEVPLAGNDAWIRTDHGTPSLAAISRLELHADTWGYGFTLWLDGMRFRPQPGPLGDVNCDGAVDFADIDPFVAALAGEAPFLLAYPDCDWLSADCNCDGVVDFADIDPFVACLGGACPCGRQTQ